MNASSPWTAHEAHQAARSASPLQNQSPRNKPSTERAADASGRGEPDGVRPDGPAKAGGQ
jgi:hypothetical protein